MRLRALVMIVVAVAASGAVVNCTGENPMAPSPPEARPIDVPPAASSTLLLSGPATVVPLHRTSPINAEQASTTVGILGGVVSLWNSGLTLVVPPFAVRSPTTITATAIAGSDVAYELAPHGLSFAVPLIAIQSLRGTEAESGGTINPFSLKVGYFPSATNITSVTELLDIGVSLHRQTAATLIWHFSGYVWSSGRDGEPSDSTGGPQ